MKILSPLTSILLICGCSSAPLQGDAQLQFIKAKADELVKAYRDGDISKMMALTHPAVIEKEGGKDKMIEKIKWELELMKNNGMAIDSQTLEAPKEVVAGGPDLFAIVPETETLVMSSSQKKITVKSVWIAVSSNKGKTWTFAHGSHFDNSRVQDTLPTFPENLKIPERVKPIVEKIN